MTRLIFHAGAGKTGSSMVQRFFSRNHDAMRDLGFYYPAPSDKEVTAGNGEAIWYYMSYDRPHDAAAYIREMRELTESANCHTTIVSCEMLIDLSREDIEDLYKYFRSQFEIIEPFVFYRDPYEWCYSAWLQAVKTGPTVESFDEYADRICSIHIQNILRFSDIFPDVLIISYDDHKHRLIETVCEITGLSVEKLSLAGESKLINRSLTAEEAEIMLVVNKHIDDHETRAEIAQILLKQPGRKNASFPFHEAIAKRVEKANAKNMIELKRRAGSNLGVAAQMPK